MSALPAFMTYTADVPPQSEPEPVEVSIVIPCLNEADTIERCVEKAVRAMREANIKGEVVVADNGSTDGSQALAERQGARVVPIAKRGYGNALMGGIEASRGKYVIMGDADDSYDFLDIPRFVEKLREGYDLAQGCRLPAGGGKVMPGAMPPSHRWIGNPMFTFLCRWWFEAPMNDVYCGYRGFTRAWYDRLDLRATGMEFATEMIIKSSRYHGKIAEVPITLHKDGRIAHAPHLRTFRDGWRTLRFYLMFSPKWLFLQPGKLLCLVGLLCFALGLFGAPLGKSHFGPHTMIVGSLALLCGFQSIFFAIATKTFAIAAGFLPIDTRMERMFRVFRLETGLIAGLAGIVLGLGMIAVVALRWSRTDFNTLPYESTLPWVIGGTTLACLGFQTMLASFFISNLDVMRR